MMRGRSSQPLLANNLWTPLMSSSSSGVSRLRQRHIPARLRAFPRRLDDSEHIRSLRGRDGQILLPAALERGGQQLVEHAVGLGLGVGAGALLDRSVVAGHAQAPVAVGALA